MVVPRPPGAPRTAARRPSAPGACVKLNDGYDILDWPFPFAYVYSESVGEWFAIFQRGFKRPARATPCEHQMPPPNVPDQ